MQAQDLALVVGTEPQVHVQALVLVIGALDLCTVYEFTVAASTQTAGIYDLCRCADNVRTSLSAAGQPSLSAAAAAVAATVTAPHSTVRWMQPAAGRQGTD
jgi:hypothetical protein